jgi:hypothetical protein
MVAGGLVSSKPGNPGRRKSSGEMLFEALIPLQPAVSRSAAAKSANRKFFQCIRTDFAV